MLYYGVSYNKDELLNKFRLTKYSTRREWGEDFGFAAPSF